MQALGLPSCILLRTGKLSFVFFKVTPYSTLTIATGYIASSYVDLLWLEQWIYDQGTKYLKLSTLHYGWLQNCSFQLDTIFIEKCGMNILTHQ